MAVGHPLNGYAQASNPVQVASVQMLQGGNALAIDALHFSWADVWAKRYAVRGFRNSSAGVAELVDALDLGSSVARRGGSSPFARTSMMIGLTHSRLT